MYNRGDYPNAFGGYSGEGPRMSMNQMSTQLLTVSIPEQETYLDLLRMRARQLWDEVKHGSRHADVLIRGGQVQRETERAAQNYHTEAGACLGIWLLPAVLSSTGRTGPVRKVFSLRLLSRRRQVLPQQ